MTRYPARVNHTTASPQWAPRGRISNGDAADRTAHGGGMAHWQGAGKRQQRCMPIRQRPPRLPALMKGEPMTVTEAAEALDYSVSHVWALIQSGAILATRAAETRGRPGEYTVDPASVAAYLRHRDELDACADCLDCARDNCAGCARDAEPPDEAACDLIPPGYRHLGPPMQAGMVIREQGGE